MRSLILAGIVICSGVTAGYADGMFWVIGNRASTTKCDIVSANPIIDGDIWFGSGPYRSLEDAKLARSTISACPKVDDKAADHPAPPSPNG